jgi:UDP-N-acetylmuramyl pentapeptide synthase
MKNLFREILKNLLGFICKRSIRKHNIEVILITGWTGSSVVRELIYHLLGEEYHVRRNVKEVWWDLSVPLSILGYEDKLRSVFGWAIIIIRATLSLIIKPKYPHKIIINLDTSNEDVASFWSKYICPHIVVVLKERPKSKIVEMLSKGEGCEKILFIYNPEFFGEFKKKNIREFIYSENKGDLLYIKDKGVMRIKYKGKEMKIRIPEAFKFVSEFLPAAVSVGLLEGLSFDTISKNLSHFSFHPKQLEGVIKQLKKFVLSDEK